jgi:hypothetical protein
MTIPGCWHLFGDSLAYLTHFPNIAAAYRRVLSSIDEQLTEVTPIGWRLLPILAPLKLEAQQYLRRLPYYTGNEFDRDDADVSPLGHLVGLSSHGILQICILALDAFRLV